MNPFYPQPLGLITRQVILDETQQRQDHPLTHRWRSAKIDPMAQLRRGRVGPGQEAAFVSYAHEQLTYRCNLVTVGDDSRDDGPGDVYTEAAAPAPV
jgi:hypothetical protein